MYLLDTDFIIASRFPQESTYHRARFLAEKIYSTDDFLITELVLMEVATVISYKYSQIQAIQAVQTLQKAGQAILQLDTDDWKNAWNLFFQQQKQRTSVVDCSNVILAQKLGAQIVSFDQFYRQFDGLLLIQ